MGNYNSDRKNARFYGLKLSRNTDGELIDHLGKQGNVQAYLKNLIKNDMTKEEGKMRIQFEAGTNANGHGINYLICMEDKDLYAEIEVPEGASDDFGYFVLKREIVAKAAEKGIEDLEFWYDGQEDKLAPDADGIVR